MTDSSYELQYDVNALLVLKYAMETVIDFFETLNEQLEEVIKILSERDKIKFYEYICTDYNWDIKSKVVFYHQVNPP